jgi:hypothetical protein
MATFESFAKGSANGIVFKPGEGETSRIVELLENGDMPRGGAKISAEELALVVTWIDEGAKFDGPDPTALLASLRPAAAGTPDAGGTRLTAVKASSKDEVQFCRDLGKVLVEQCLGCHGTQNQGNNLSFNTFDSLLRGGDSGAPLVPGKPGESLLVQKLRGMAGERMPLNRPALPEETIAKFEKWIALGARFDGADPAAPTDETVALVIALGATHDELSASRAELAAKNWRLILPDATTEAQQTTQVLVYGSPSPVVLAEVAKVADEQAARLAALFKRPADRPLIKGRLTLYVFLKRYEYGEVGVMIERREIPPQWQGHWRYTGVDAYGCILLDGDNVPPGLVAQQIAGAYIASLGKVPAWFAEGSARALAAKLDRKDERAKQWDEAAARILQSAETPEAFLSGELAPEDSDVLSYAFVRHLMTGWNRYASLAAALHDGTSFDEAFRANFRATPAELVDQWQKRAGARRAR